MYCPVVSQPEGHPLGSTFAEFSSACRIVALLVGAGDSELLFRHKFPSVSSTTLDAPGALVLSSSAVVKADKGNSKLAIVEAFIVPGR